MHVSAYQSRLQVPLWRVQPYLLHAAQAAIIYGPAHVALSSSSCVRRAASRGGEAAAGAAGLPLVRARVHPVGRSRRHHRSRRCGAAQRQKQQHLMRTASTMIARTAITTMTMITPLLSA